MKHITDKFVEERGRRTICEVLREIYDIVYDSEDPSREEIMELLNESYVYGKKMDAKLRQYKNGYDQDWWEQESIEVRQAKLERRKNR